MTVFLEYLRKKLGWCPNAAAAGTGRRRYTIRRDGEVGIGTAAGGDREIVEGVFVDYASPRFLAMAILVFGGLFVVAFLIPSLRAGFSILAGLSFMTFAAVHFYFDTKRGVIESSGNTVIVRRSRSRPLVFGKDAFRSVVVKKTSPLILRRAFALLLIFMYAGLFFIWVWTGWMPYPGGQAVDPDFVYRAFFKVGFAVFMLELLYRALIGLQYPGHLKVTLEPAGFLHIYTNDPERVARALEAVK